MAEGRGSASATTRRIGAIAVMVAIGAAGVVWSGCGSSDDSGDASTAVEQGADQAQKGVEEGEDQAQKGVEEGEDQAKQGVEKGEDEAKQGVEKGENEAKKYEDKYGD